MVVRVLGLLTANKTSITYDHVVHTVLENKSMSNLQWCAYSAIKKKKKQNKLTNTTKKVSCFCWGWVLLMLHLHFQERMLTGITGNIFPLPLSSLFPVSKVTPFSRFRVFFLPPSIWAIGLFFFWWRGAFDNWSSALPCLSRIAHIGGGQGTAFRSFNSCERNSTPSSSNLQPKSVLGSSCCTVAS